MTALRPVMFSPADYASRPRRIASCLVDIACLFALVLASYFFFSLKYVPAGVRAMPESADKNRLIRQHLQPVAAQQSLAALGLCIGYLVLLRKTPVGTLGRILTGTRLVGPDGRSPSWASLARRFILNGLSAFAGLLPYTLLAGSGKGNHPVIVSLGLVAGVGFVIHYVYGPCAKSPLKQALHDRWSGHWVIRRGATPIGPAELHEKAVFVGSFPLKYVALEPAADMMASAVAVPNAEAPTRPVTTTHAL